MSIHDKSITGRMASKSTIAIAIAIATTEGVTKTDYLLIRPPRARITSVEHN
jgi:hypothetical protein